MFDHECNGLKSINKKSMRMVNNSILKLLPVSGSDGGGGILLCAVKNLMQL